jgi:hypothetical protein
MSAAKNENPAELDEFLERHPDTQSLELLQPDMIGILRGKRVGTRDFAKAFKSGVNFCGATVLLDSQGQTFERIDNGGRDGDPDVISWAVSGSLAPVPWAQVPSAQVLLAMFDEQGEPYFADPRQVLRRAARPIPVVAGAVAGVGAAYLATGTIRSFLFEVSPTDPPTLIAVAVTLVAAGMVAALVPALRAARVDPVSSLRAD